MALYAFDGTGNEDRATDEHGNNLDSNVLDFFLGYSDPNRNDDPKKETGSLYLKGIGTMAKTDVGQTVAKAFGIGGHRRIRLAMERLENNFDAGDTEIDVVGFSRGAATAVSFANTLATRFPHVRIRFLGLWDIVGQFGAPGEHVNAGHDLDMPPNVDHCYHAMALDETRALFPLTRLGTNTGAPAGVQEVWFRGVHSDVGGGNGNPSMNWLSLHWMYQNALRHRLPIAGRAVESNMKDSFDQNGIPRPRQLTAHTFDLRRAREIFAADVLHHSVGFDPDPNGRFLNNPPHITLLSRVDDEGAVIDVAGV
jgi:uncharacterized protein (DUF2235 family)